MNRVVMIEQVANDYVVVITPVKDEPFFNDLDEVISYLKFYFNVEVPPPPEAPELNTFTFKKEAES